MKAINSALAATLTMLDLFAGLGGASAAMKDRGWDVYTLDIEPSFHPDFITSVQNFSWYGPHLDLIWASPPCEEFSREHMPWCKTGKEPDMKLIKEALRIIEEAKPTYWIIENTAGAVKWFRPLLGEPKYVAHPIFLWGKFPPLPKLRLKMRKEKYSSTQAAQRAMIPYKLSLAVAQSMEMAINFLGREDVEAHTQRAGCPDRTDNVDL